MLHSIRVADYMTRQVIALSPGLTIDQAIAVLLQYRISGAPVIEHQRLVGMFSESDCLKELLNAGYHDMACGRVCDYMSACVDTIGAEDTIVTAAELLLARHRRRLPVIDAQGRLVGQISRRDVLRAIEENRSAVPLAQTA